MLKRTTKNFAHATDHNCAIDYYAFDKRDQEYGEDKDDVIISTC